MPMDAERLPARERPRLFQKPMLKALIKRFVPKNLVAHAAAIAMRRQKRRIARLPILTEGLCRDILVSRLGLRNGDTVIVHSSIDRLNLGFPFYRILSLLQEIVGKEGTILFPTYPKLASYEFLRTGGVFDVRKTPSYTGILTEFARRQRGAIRSLCPAKSVCAIGPRAAGLTATHQDSPYPYDHGSPYYKIMEFNGKIIGIGVGTRNLSFVHCVDDYLKDDFPVRPYHEQLFPARCVNYAGEEVIVPTYAHDMRKMNHDVPRYMKKHISTAASEDIVVDGMNFFRADSVPLFEEMLDLARKGITMYPAESYGEHET